MRIIRPLRQQKALRQLIEEAKELNVPIIMINGPVIIQTGSGTSVTNTVETEEQQWPKWSNETLKV